MSSNTDPDNVYVNARINYIEGTSSLISPAIYDVTKTSPIVNNPREYYVSVIGLSIPFNTMPIIICPIIPDQPNPNLTTFNFIITVPANNYSVNQNCIYVPTRIDLPVPVQNKPYQVITPYYNIYSFTWLLNIFNTTLTNLWNTAVLANPLVNLGPQAPYFYINEDKLIVLVVSDQFKNNARIGTNGATLTLLEGFNFSDTTYSNAYVDNAFFTFYDNGNVCNSDGGQLRVPGNGYWYYIQEYNAIDIWYSVRRVFVTTTAIPINQDVITVNDNNGKQTGLTAYYPILFDYTPQITNNIAGKSVNYYEPQSQYRLIDINSDQPLYRIDLLIFWQDKLGNNYQIFLTPGQSINVKLGFFKKSLYKNYWPQLLR